MSGKTDWIINKEMGISHKEFFRKLPLVFKGETYEVAGDRVLFSENRQSVEIIVGEEGRRKLGLVGLPFTRLELRLSGYDEQAMKAFIHHFDIQYFRGGG